MNERRGCMSPSLTNETTGASIYSSNHTCLVFLEAFGEDKIFSGDPFEPTPAGRRMRLAQS
jgi:hypothetical protein